MINKSNYDNKKHKPKYGFLLGVALQGLFDNPPYIPEKKSPNFRWNVQVFVEHHDGASESAVRQWLRGDALPTINLEGIIKTIFGPNRYVYKRAVDNFLMIFRYCLRLQKASIDPVSQIGTEEFEAMKKAAQSMGTLNFRSDDQTEEHDDLAIAQEAAATNLFTAYLNVPRPGPHFVGRENDIDIVCAALLSRSTSQSVGVIVKGGPGIGKTALTQFVAYDPRIIERFGRKNRWFVQLEAAFSAKEMREAIALAVEGRPGAPFADALETLTQNPGLLILDNLETPWESPKTLKGREETEEVITELGEIHGLGILASFRGDNGVGGLDWALSHIVVELRDKYPQILFCNVSKRPHDDDPYFFRLLDALGGIPLAIKLVAWQAGDGIPWSELWQRWEDAGPSLACYYELEPERLTSLPRSIKLSLDSPRLTQAGRSLFELLGQTPAGMATRDRRAIMGAEAEPAATSLISTGLASRRGSRVDMLPPIREYAARNCPPSEDSTERWVNHYLDMARAADSEVFKQGGSAATERLITEVPNIEAAIHVSKSRPALRRSAVDAAIGFQPLMTITGIGSISTLQLLADACRDEGDSEGEAKVCVRIGIIADERGEPEIGWQVLERAWAAYERIGNQINVEIGKGDCLYRMADIKLHTARAAEARDLYVRSLNFYELQDNFQGMGDSTHRLAEFDWSDGMVSAAKEKLERAIQYFRKANYLVGEANSTFLLAQIMHSEDDLIGAEAQLSRAKFLYTETKYHHGFGHCIRFEGEVAFNEANFELSRERYREARAIFVSTNSKTSQADCDLFLGKIETKLDNVGAAKEHFQSAANISSKARAWGIAQQAYSFLIELTSGDEREALVSSAQYARRQAN